MKVLYITLENLSLHKGSVIHIKKVIAGLQQKGHEIGLIGRVSQRSNGTASFHSDHEDGLPWVRRLRIRGKSYLISSIWLFLYLFKLVPKYDMIYARDYHTAIIALLPRLLFKRKLALELNGLANEEQKLKGETMTNYVLSALIKRAEKIAVCSSDKIISVTPKIEDYLAKEFQCPRGKVSVVGNGVDKRAF